MIRSYWLSVSSALALLSCGTNPAKTAKICTGHSDNKMVYVPGGSFIMGDGPHYPEEGPPHRVTLHGFWIDTHEVTNAQFAAFVRVSGYRTMAERAPPNLPGATPEMTQPGSAVFNTPSAEDPRWWHWQVGASWRHPSGPNENITEAKNTPVVQIAYQDALAYTAWVKKQLPSEEQWEYAARGGTAVKLGTMNEKGKPTANTYQGIFPARNLGTDGYIGRAPVGCFPANAFGLYDMIGNVWEWTSTSGRRADASEAVNIIKGGSYLCAANYCARYRPAARQFQERGLGTDHIGFRLVDNVKAAPRGEVGNDRP